MSDDEFRIAFRQVLRDLQIENGNLWRKICHLETQLEAERQMVGHYRERAVAAEMSPAPSVLVGLNSEDDATLP